jgi:NADH:ubiquinone reductase (H+-translocating)
LGVLKEEVMKSTIIVLGGGYTGVMNAVSLARRTRRTGARVMLVNPSDRFTERLRMHQIATDQSLADYRISALLAGTGAELVQGRAVRIDPEQREIAISHADREQVLAYDYLVYAIGSVTDTSTVPGVDAHADTLDTPAAAGRLAGRLAEVADESRVAVVGAGLTGVEAAAEIAESYPNLHVVLLGYNEPGSTMSQPARRYLHHALDRLGVEIRAGVKVTKILPDAVELASGELMSTRACLWTTGFVAPTLASEAGLTVDTKGRVVVDSTLASVSHPSVYAIGDAAAIRQAWGEIHGTCQSGIPTGAHAADAIARRIRGKKPKPFRFGYLHQPVSIGRQDAVIQFTRPDDSPTRWYITGRAAVAYKQAVTSSPLKTYRLSRWITIPPWTLARSSGRANRPVTTR